eukprot:1922098-Rhodomonas_salina.1
MYAPCIYAPALMLRAAVSPLALVAALTVCVPAEPQLTCISLTDKKVTPRQLETAFRSGFGPGHSALRRAFRTPRTHATMCP